MCRKMCAAAGVLLGFGGAMLLSCLISSVFLKVLIALLALVAGAALSGG